MRFSTSAVVACAVAFVAAQDLSSIPSCALPCFAAAIQSSGCSLSDSKCQCTTGNAKITESLTTCAPSKCSVDDLAKIAPAAAAICSAAGYNNVISSVAITSAASAATASMASGTMAASKSASMSMSNSASASSALPQATGAAAGNYINGALVIAMGVLAL